MEKLAINLLPPEFGVEAKNKTKKQTILRVSIIFLVLTIIAAGIVLGMEIYQRLNLTKTEKQIEAAKGQITALHDAESLNFLLKSRLNSITNINSQNPFDAQTFNLITILMPPDVRMLTFNIGRNNQITIAGDTTSNPSLQVFFNNLIDPSSNEGKIQSVNIESLSLGQNGRIRFDLTLTLSGATSVKKISFLGEKNYD